ncbi:MAG: aspartate--ammonia ligase [Spirochaetes bacterium GWD1_61_31]|nr:MAG: aspartate--ammonia ligase [Spirochaetes bacterium GWB1_60_80]OHD33303.1 MAG: aspartate--ammonia ligase [Spirochaetes bacterium GWC1_61_12]OHD41576.1 MAG: aspartate--ammonia ligase [Spirochaetes bacterium GWE1_60_18]OHD44318.1 MAG: aspartate--ammonia ligase [Spirochaetes bacterium GWD1_61_31]OHD61481.1 MAG: aspartate--ammonia ligase [Spirochaetes bacterium GWF1_60_12]HAP43395.1 aspartate--ammonia ligase [Spirochaetaceae bacterium]
MQDSSPLTRPAGASIGETEHAIKLIKDFFQLNLASELNLSRVTAPLFVPAGTGINDDLNGVERPVSFPVKALGDQRVEVVHSLAKWKRLALADYGFAPGFGLYTDMNAIRADEELDATHSLYVDQWDWEKVLTDGERTLETLYKTVRRIYAAMKRLEFHLHDRYPALPIELPEDIRFVHSQEALNRYPELTPRQREDALAAEYGAVFLVGIGGQLSNGQAHDGRAADYDDWSSPNEEGYQGLNGDIIVWNPTLGRALELSSMGIRVSPEALERQLSLAGQEGRRQLYFHRRLLAGELPACLGGGIGQSRLCMHFLHKAHIGEIQVGLWPQAMRRDCAARGIQLL